MLAHVSYRYKVMLGVYSKYVQIFKHLHFHVIEIPESICKLIKKVCLRKKMHKTFMRCSRDVLK